MATPVTQLTRNFPNFFHRAVDPDSIRANSSGSTARSKDFGELRVPHRSPIRRRALDKTFSCCRIRHTILPGPVTLGVHTPLVTSVLDVCAPHVLYNAPFVYVRNSGLGPRFFTGILTADQSHAGSAGIFSRRTNQTQETWVYSHNGPIRRRKRGYILTADQSDAGSVGIFSRRTNQTQEAWVYSHDGQITRRKRGYILTMDQSDAGSA
eukprot:1182269-Prorocentrum_minimum.AAC.1